MRFLSRDSWISANSFISNWQWQANKINFSAWVQAIIPLKQLNGSVAWSKLFTIGLLLLLILFILPPSTNVGVLLTPGVNPGNAFLENKLRLWGDWVGAFPTISLQLFSSFFGRELAPPFRVASEPRLWRSRRGLLNNVLARQVQNYRMTNRWATPSYVRETNFAQRARFAVAESQFGN